MLKHHVNLNNSLYSLYEVQYTARPIFDINAKPWSS
jgi:hypothetical protein